MISTDVTLRFASHPIVIFLSESGDIFSKVRGGLSSPQFWMNARINMLVDC